MNRTPGEDCVKVEAAIVTASMCIFEIKRAPYIIVTL